MEHQRRHFFDRKRRIGGYKFVLTRKKEIWERDFDRVHEKTTSRTPEYNLHMQFDDLKCTNVQYPSWLICEYDSSILEVKKKPKKSEKFQLLRAHSQPYLLPSS